VAGLLALAASGELPSGAVVVCVLTGHGLKDAEWGIRDADPPVLLPADAAAIAAHLGLEAP
jgi:threonine synthase